MEAIEGVVTPTREFYYHSDWVYNKRKLMREGTDWAEDVKRMAREENQAREPSMRRRRRSLYDPESFGDFDPRTPYDASFLTPEELSQSPIPS